MRASGTTIYIFGLLAKNAIEISENPEKHSQIVEILNTPTLSASFQNISWSQKAGIAIKPRSTKLHHGFT